METQTKGGKPVSSGAPRRREQPFYSNPGGKATRVPVAAVGRSVGADLSVLSNRTSLLLSSRDSPARGGRGSGGGWLPRCRGGAGGEEDKYLEWYFAGAGEGGREGGRGRDNRPVSEFL